MKPIAYCETHENVHSMIDLEVLEIVHLDDLVVMLISQISLNESLAEAFVKQEGDRLLTEEKTLSIA